MSFSISEQIASSYDEEELQNWIFKHWPKTIFISALYFVLVFAGRQWMAERQKFNLRWSLTIWSGSLAAFSILGTWYTWSRMITDLREKGFRESVCDNSYFNQDVGVWLFLFSLSKVLELGDTLFIVARKQRLIFLHWYHHMATLVYTWYVYGSGGSMALWFASMNFAVHSLMYSYYALRASKLVRLPRGISVMITSLQLLQMLCGMYITVYAYNEYHNDRPCATDWSNLVFGFAMYTSYAILFADFFWQNYLNKCSKSKHDDKIKKS